MKLLFIHDNRFWRYGKEVYSYGHFAYELLWKRYLAVFDEIRVGGRFHTVEESKEIAGMSRSDGPGVSFFELPNLMSLRGLLDLSKASRKIREEMEQADMVIARLPSNLGYLACHVAKRLGKPYMIELVGCTWDDLWNYGTLAGKLTAIPSFLLQRHYVRRAPNVLYVSRHFLQRRYPCKGHTVSCPDTSIHESSPAILEKRLEFIREMGQRSQIRIGLIASLNVGYKGHDTAIKALSLLVKKYPKLMLCFLGDGDKGKWERMAADYGVADHIDFCGSLPGGEPVLNWLDGLDIFIMPSLQETLGRALLEAMSRAVPAIGGAGTAVAEQLPDDCIHQRKDYNDLARLLDEMLSSPKYMELCASENYYRARKYCEEFLMNRREAFWRECIQGLLG